MHKLTNIIIVVLLLFFLFSFEVTDAVSSVHENFYNGDYRAALTRMENLEQTEIDEIGEDQYYKHLAFLYYEVGELEKYVSNLKKAFSSTSRNPQTALQLAIAHYLVGDYDEAEDYFADIYSVYRETKASIYNDIKLGRFYLYRGYNARDRGHKDKAIQYWTEGREVQPTNPRFDVVLGEMAADNGDYQKALEFYESARRKDGSYSYLFPRMGEAAERSNQYRLAWEYWRKSYEVGILRKKAEQETARLENLFPDIKPEPEEKIEADWEPEWWPVKPISTDGNIPELEVGIGQKTEQQLFQVDSVFQIVNERGDIILSEGAAHTEWGLKRTEKGEFQLAREGEHLLTFSGEYSLEIIPFGENASIMLHNIPYGSGYFFAGRTDRQYRGTIKINPREENKIWPVNRVNMQEYLLSVVPSEMSASWPREALKAQALAARSYALNNMGRRRSKYGFDLFDTVADAAYSGIKSEHSRTTKAVLDTQGQVGVYEGEIVNAVFSSNSGGFTEESSHVWGSSIPYLQEVDLNIIESKFDFPLLPANLREWYHTRPDTYSGPGNYSYRHAYRWSREIPIAFLEENLGLDKITDFKITERSSRGFVKEIVVSGQEKEVPVRGGIIRSTLGGIKSNSFTALRKFASDGELELLVLYGAGWGHGVGLDQTAAARMADTGENYRDIFTKFYTGIEVEKRY
ncbi:MAG: SpoIID/LytB domain-containing protein [Bacillota bacterium]